MNRIFKIVVLLLMVATVVMNFNVATKAKGKIKYIKSNSPIKLTQTIGPKRNDPSGKKEKILIKDLFDIKVKCYGSGGDYEDVKGNLFKYVTVKNLGFNVLQGSAINDKYMYIAFTDKGRKNNYQAKRDLTLIVKVDLATKTVCPVTNFYGLEKLDLYGLGHANDLIAYANKNKREEIDKINSAWYKHHYGPKKKDEDFDNRIGIYNSQDNYSYGGENIVDTNLKGLIYIFGIAPYNKRVALGTVVKKNDKKKMYVMSYKFKTTSYEKGKKEFEIKKNTFIKDGKKLVSDKEYKNKEKKAIKKAKNKGKKELKKIINYNVAQCMEYCKNQFYIVKYNEPKLEKKKKVEGTKRHQKKIKKENSKIVQRNKIEKKRNNKCHNNIVEIYKNKKKIKTMIIKDPKIGNKNWKKDKWEVECFKYSEKMKQFYYTQYHPVKKQKMAYLFSCKK